MKSVYKIPQKIKGLSDERKRKSIPLFNIVMPVLIFLMLQYESFHTIFSAPESMEKQLKNCIRGKIPKVDAVRDLLSRIDPKEIEEIHAQTIDVLKRNRVFREGTIGGYVAAGIDGMELFSSTKKSCTDCLSRKNGTGKTKYVINPEAQKKSAQYKERQAPGISNPQGSFFQITGQHNQQSLSGNRCNTVAGASDTYIERLLV